MAAPAAAAVAPQRFSHREVVLATASTAECVVWLRREGLLAVQQACPRCGPNVMMLDQRRSNSTDGCQWRCPNARCRTTSTVRAGSFFIRSHLPLTKLVDVTYFWSIGSTHLVIQNEVIVHFWRTITKHNKTFIMRHTLATCQCYSLRVGLSSVVREYFFFDLEKVTFWPFFALLNTGGEP